MRVVEDVRGEEIDGEMVEMVGMVERREMVEMESEELFIWVRIGGDEDSRDGCIVSFVLGEHGQLDREESERDSSL